MKFLVDYNLRGQAVLLWGTLASEGWLELLPIRFVNFEEVGLLADSSDRAVWQVAQNNRMFILTANRNMEGDDSLEQIIRENNRASSFPVVTISDKERLDERTYRERCAIRLIETLIDVENYMGVGRIYIP